MPQSRRYRALRQTDRQTDTRGLGKGGLARSWLRVRDLAPNGQHLA
jgi:hypothetical protein